MLTSVLCVWCLEAECSPVGAAGSDELSPSASPGSPLDRSPGSPLDSDEALDDVPAELLPPDLLCETTDKPCAKDELTSATDQPRAKHLIKVSHHGHLTHMNDWHLTQVTHGHLAHVTHGHLTHIMLGIGPHFQFYV